MNKLVTSLIASSLAAALAVACSAADKSQFTEGDDDGSGGAGSDQGAGVGGLDFGGTQGAGAGILGEEPDCSDSDPNDDGDADGWTDAQGDCNDCTDLMNPGAYDYTGNGIDEDCNGATDDHVAVCDSALTLDSGDALDGARAMDLCKMASGESWGVVSAEYIMVDGTPGPAPEGHGILTGFGPMVNPQAGSKLLAISSGTARQPTDPGYQDPGGHDKGYTSGAAPGYPQESPACPGVITGEPHDSIALRVRIRTPTNAKSLAFNVNMYTYEFPIFICSVYNDFVTVIMSPTPPGQTTGNISYDSQGNSLSVNAGFLEVCDPHTAGGKNFPCLLTSEQLTGTGFEGHAATGWLQTATTIYNPGDEITLEFGAWDSGDGILDTTGLFDNFRFEAEDTPTETKPIDDPK